MPSLLRLSQLVGGCLMLGAGVTLLLLAALGSDGFSTFVYGITLATGAPFIVVNLVVSVSLLAVAWARGIRPGVGTVAQVAIVGAVAHIGLSTIPEPGTLWVRVLVGTVALPVLATGIATYLGSHLGAGPLEAAALAWDPPLRFALSFNVLQLIGAFTGWRLGAPIGVGTVAVVLGLGPLVALLGRLLRLDLHQPGGRVGA